MEESREICQAHLNVRETFDQLYYIKELEMDVS